MVANPGDIIKMYNRNYAGGNYWIYIIKTWGDTEDKNNHPRGAAILVSDHKVNDIHLDMGVHVGPDDVVVMMGPTAAESLFLRADYETGTTEEIGNGTIA